MVARGSGRVLNVASIAAFQPIPSLATYAATKAYVLSLTESLSEELRGTGVTLTALCPGITATGMLSKAKQVVQHSGAGPDSSRQRSPHVHAVYLVKLGQCGGQLCGAAAVRRAETLHQLGDAVAHKIAVLRSIVLGPAVGGADAVGGVRQIVDRVQQGSVKVK